MGVRRREWLKLLGATGGMLVARRLLAAGEDPVEGSRRIERVGVQLYTVRDAMARDVAGTLAAVAAIGYAEVETAGTGNLNPQQFAIALNNAGLTAPAAHVPLELLQTQPDEVLMSAEVIGYRHLVVPWLKPELRNASGYAGVIDTLNSFGERCAAQGLRLCYHNHDFEFQPLGDGVAYDLLLAECDRRFVGFELDLFWAVHAGADPAGYLGADPARFPLCHVKDRNAAGEMVDVGAGIVDFPALFAVGSGLEHYFVEHDRPADSLASIAASFRAVRRMRF